VRDRPKRIYAEIADPRHRGLLRARRERPRRRSAEQCDELAPSHGGVPQGQGSRTDYSRSGAGRWRASQQKAAPNVRVGSIASHRQVGGVRPMSASPPIATRRSRRSETPLCHKRTHARQQNLFDHLVGAGEQTRRHGEAQRLGGLKVDHQLVFGRRLHRKISRLRALEDAVDIAAARRT